MKIDVMQTNSEGKNEFEIKYNEILKYKAVLPFIVINEPFKLERIREICIYNTNNEKVYETNYNYVENLKEEFIPFKFLVDGSQKFNQLIFKSEVNTIKIYYEENAIWKARYVIEQDNKRYYCYSVDDGYIRHLPIYDGEKQIGEVLKSNVVIDAKDEYCCYLKDEYESIADGIVSLLLFLDRTEYNSSFLINKSYVIKKKYSYSKNNKYYDRDWVKNNFGEEFYEKVNNDVKITKEKLKHQIKTHNEMFESMTEKNKKRLTFIILFPWIAIAVFVVILLLLFVIDNYSDNKSNETIFSVKNYLSGKYMINNKKTEEIYYFSENGKFAFYKGRECLTDKDQIISYYGTWEIDNNDLIINVFGEEKTKDGELLKESDSNLSCLYNYQTISNTKIKDKTIKYSNVSLQDEKNLQYLKLNDKDNLYQVNNMEIPNLNIVNYLAESNTYDKTYFSISEPIMNKVDGIYGKIINDENKSYFEYNSKNCTSNNINYSISVSNGNLTYKDLNKDLTFTSNKIKNVKQMVSRSASASCDGVFNIIITKDGELYYNVPHSITNIKSIEDLDNEFYKLNSSLKFESIIGQFNYSCQDDEFCGIPLSYTILKTTNNIQMLFYPSTSKQSVLIEYKNVNDSEKISCKYTQNVLESLVKKYFVGQNGEYAENGEKYDVESILYDNKDYYLVRIKHLYNDHVSTDESYLINCNTAKGRLFNEKEDNIEFLDYLDH